MINAVILAAIAVQAPGSLSPLGPVAEGKVECYQPDVASKTCHSMAFYKPRPDGSFDNGVRFLLSPDPLIIATGQSRVFVRDGAVCGTLTAEDMQQTTFEIDGQPASPELTQKLLKAMQASMSTLYGKDMCTTYAASADKLVAHSSVNGTPRPELDEVVVWVSPAESFKVAPQPH